MEERIYIECQCGSPDHLVSFFRDEDDVGVNVQMSPYLPIWRRVLVALRYALGLDTRCHWGDALLTPAERARVARFLTQTP
jgi:hypothetical protein